MRKFLVLPLLLLASFSFAGSKYQTDYLTVTSSMKLGAVMVVHSSGTYDVYSPTDSTEGAFGAALVRSQSSWTDKISILLGPGTFDMGENYLTLYTSTRSALIGAGKNLTYLKFSGAGYGIQPSSFCYLANFASGGSGAGIGGLSEVTGTHLILDDIYAYGDQDAIAINYNYDKIDIINSEFGTTFDAMVFVNTNSSATVNIYDSKFISKDGSINASGVNCYGVGIVNSWNTIIEVRDAGTRVGYGNGSGLGTCTFNIYGGDIETYNGGTDIATYSGSANVTSDLVYISSKTSGTINQLNQSASSVDTSQVYGTTTTPTYPYGVSVSSDGVTFNVNTAGISGFVGTGKSFSISTDEGSSLTVSETSASLYANQNASITGETNVNIAGLMGVNISANNSPIVLNPNYSGGTGGSVTVKDVLAVNDANSQFETYVGTLPVNSGFGPQVVTGGIWNRTNNSGDTLGSFNLVVSTTPRRVTAGGAPVIPGKGGSLSFTSSGVSYSTYNFDGALGEVQWTYASDGFTVNNAVTGTKFVGDGSELTNIPLSATAVTYSSASVSYLGKSSSTLTELTKSSATVSYLGKSSSTVTELTKSSATVSYLGKSSSTITELTKSSASVSYIGIGTYTATTGTFQKSTMTAESYQTILSSNTTTSINWQSGDAKTQTITASSTYTFTNLPTGTTSKTLNMRVINTGSFKMTWPSTIKWTSGVSGSSPTASGVTIYTFQVFDGTVYGAFIDGFSR